MNSTVLEQRRERFYEQMGSGVAILFAAPVANRNSDVDYEYRPDTNFYYLTGFGEPGAAAVFTPDDPDTKYTLFVRPRDPAREVWDGLRAGVEGAVKLHGADRAFTIDRLDRMLPEYLENVSTLYHRLGRFPREDGRVMQAIKAVQAKYRSGVTWPTTYRDPSDILGEMRLFKRPEDAACLRRATEITCEAHQEAMRAARPGGHEYEVEAVVEFIFRRRGSASWGYPSICGSGPNSCILHYNENNRQMQDGDLLLVDAGCEHELFTGDCTRTFPVNGKFSEAQRQIYSLCLQGQKAAIDVARPGSRFLDVHQAAVDVIAPGLLELGLLSGTLKEIMEKQTFSKFFMHRTSHWLGMDVHDVGDYRKDGDSRILESGMVLTVEPGIYVAERSEGADEKWWNIGVRIEDDVLITEDGNEVLTAAAPKEIDEVERLCQEPSRYI